jgi:hypothetical protein
MDSRQARTPDDLIHARIKLRQRQRFLEKRQRTGIPAHGLILLDAFPLRVHRHFRAIETAMKRRRDKTGRLTDKFIGHTNEEIDEPLLVGRLNCKDVYQDNHVHCLLRTDCSPGPKSGAQLLAGRDRERTIDRSRPNSYSFIAATLTRPPFRAISPPLQPAWTTDRAPSCGLAPRHGKAPDVWLDFEQFRAR